LISSVLIANRGEIACRIADTAKKLGICVIAVYSEADKDALHVSKADKALCIGGASPDESYLNIENIMQAALDSNVQSLHPGYGFLSENAVLARHCEQESIQFIGPASQSIELMASKSSAAQIAVQAGVAVLRGYRDSEQNSEKMKLHASEIGFPVLLKSAMGGGGRGMRIVQNMQEFDDALTAAKSESMQSFGDDQIIVEKYLNSARHIEVQIAVDERGNAVHLFDRECSIQRRYQKIIEEAPAPRLSDTLRKRLSDAAVAIAVQLGYRNIGTIEFLLSGEDFYFMEMNTRLQVEHPVTEQITGTDLVEWQFRIANGESIRDFPLPEFAKGHSIEARIYAENPARQFVPSSGRIGCFDLPHKMKSIQIHTGYRPQDQVSQHYDPLLAKVVSAGNTRNKALANIIEAFDEIVISGVQTNVNFLSNLFRHQLFYDASADLGFVEKHLDDLIPETDDLPEQIPIAAALVLHSKANRRETHASLDSETKSAWSALHGWRLNGASKFTYIFVYHSKIVHITLTFPFYDKVCDSNDGTMPVDFSAWYENRHFVGRGACSDTGRVKVRINQSTAINAHVERTGDNHLNVYFQGRIYELSINERFVPQIHSNEKAGSLSAPMSGKVVRTNVQTGQSVSIGQNLMVIEAMKMEHQISAPIDGVVTEVAYNEGDQVEEGAMCVVIESSENPRQDQAN